MKRHDESRLYRKRCVQAMQRGQSAYLTWCAMQRAADNEAWALVAALEAFAASLQHVTFSMDNICDAWRARLPVADG